MSGTVSPKRFEGSSMRDCVLSKAVLLSVRASIPAPGVSSLHSSRWIALSPAVGGPGAEARTTVNGPGGYPGHSFCDNVRRAPLPRGAPVHQLHGKTLDVRILPSGPLGREARPGARKKRCRRDRGQVAFARGAPRDIRAGLAATNHKTGDPGSPARERVGICCAASRRGGVLANPTGAPLAPKVAERQAGGPRGTDAQPAGRGKETGKGAPQVALRGRRGMGRDICRMRAGKARSTCREAKHGRRGQCPKGHHLDRPLDSCHVRHDLGHVAWIHRGGNTQELFGDPTDGRRREQDCASRILSRCLLLPRHVLIGA